LLSGSSPLYAFGAEGRVSMHSSDHPAWIRYGVALLCVGLATFVRFAAHPVFLEDHQFATFYLAVIISAWFGGAGPALLATALGGLIGHYCFVAPRYSFAFADADDAMTVGMFFLVSVSITLFSGLLHRTLRRAQAYAERLQSSEREKNRLYEEARHANEAKDRFLATVSHELRTPVGGILLWSKLIKAGTLGEARRQDAMEKIIQCAEDQSQLVNDLLDTSRIIHGKMQVDMLPVDLTAVVRSSVDGVQAEARAGKIELCLHESDAVVLGDGTRLRQVVSNLLTNAIKFTPPGGHVEVRLNCEKGTARLQVTDSGEGISPEYLPKMFIHFSQADTSLTRKHGGLGLGLYIVKEIVEMHGGSVWAESKGLGRGARFTVTLPLLTEASGAEAEPHLLAH
jgi:signal transduction histidine kinase